MIQPGITDSDRSLEMRKDGPGSSSCFDPESVT